MKCELPWEFHDFIENFPVALKMIINFHEIQTTTHVNHTKNEFDILSDSALQLHPNIVRMLGKFDCKPTNTMLEHVDESIRDLCFRSDGQVKGAQFFMLQFYNKTLFNVIKNENPSKKTIIKYAVQISRALLHLYESKIAHLDLKLDNSMISGTDEIVIVDFGCASKLDYLFKVFIKSHSPGNLAHLAPEVIHAINNRKRLPCKDQFSWELGVLLFEMLSNGIFLGIQILLLFYKEVSFSICSWATFRSSTTT